MRPEAVAELLDRIIDLAEAQDLDELRNFDFISFGNPWRKVAHGPGPFHDHCAGRSEEAVPNPDSEASGRR